MSTSKNSPNSSPLTQSQVREVLQYVPVFSGRTFVVAVDGDTLSDTVTAEVLLDLITLQRIGVKLVLAYSGNHQADLLDWAAEVELKLSESSVKSCSGVLDRGQAALVCYPPKMVFSADLVALAVAVDAEKVLYLGKVEDYPLEWDGALNLSDAKEVLTEVHEGQTSYWAIDAVSKGVNRVHLLDGTMRGCLSRELFSNEGVGIMIYADSYQQVRSLSEEDIPELLAIIGRSIRAQHLLPRTYEEVESQLSDYFVMSIDGNVVGSVAVHPYGGETCELACLFVKSAHKGLGYGHVLVKFAEEHAKASGFQKIFALSTDANGFFQEQLGYKPVPLDEIPPERHDKLKNSGRSSIALLKKL